jgi:hypothetical protein
VSELLLIAVPGSDDAGAPVLRVVLVPALDAATSVAKSPMAEWPATIASARFDVELDPGGTLEGIAPRSEASPEAWKSFFGGAVRVDGATPPVAGAAPVVTPSAELAKEVHDTYRDAASIPIDPKAGEHPELDAQVAGDLRERWAADTAPGPPPAVDSGAGKEATPDFHRILDLLHEHPAVMRALGLVIELPIDRKSLPGEGTVRVLWPKPPDGITVISQPTAYEVHGDRGFVPASTKMVKAGMVDLGDGDSWAATTFDVDGAADRLRDAARALGTGAQPARLPALRSAGIALMRRDLETEFAGRRATVETHRRARGSDKDGPPLTADELMLGLRFDVRLKGESEWVSLCRREARYVVDEDEVLSPAEEEGHVKLAVAVQHEGGALRADEIVARWSGWSLAVPHGRPDAKDNDEGSNGLPFDFKREFGVIPGSLLPLRFGRDYHLRARIADLAGGGHPPTDPNVALGTEPISYARHEPLGSPSIGFPKEVEASRLGPGGTIELLVIRDDAPEYPRNDSRELRAPMTTLDVAEQHGVLDGADAATFGHVQRALSGGLPDPAAGGVTVFSRPGAGAPDARAQTLGWPGKWPDADPVGLRLMSQAADGDHPVLDPSGNDIRVFLKPAEQVTIELSSFPEDAFFGHLALPRLQPDSAGEKVAKDGRQPLLSPPRVLTLIHAVRQPLATPGGALTPQQEEGGTAATLQPSTRLLNVDPASTVQLQVAAGWDEVDDDAVHPVRGAPVCNVAIERGDEELRGPLVHAFGDTRHRMVHYELTAVSRFRDLYESDEDDEQFVTRAELEPVSVKSTARPPVPAVRSVVPAFRWEDLPADGALKRRREGGRLRVELLRPWHLSGEGERLAVVVEQTEVGRDPIWETPEVERVPPASAYLAPEAPADATLPDGTAVTVVPFEVGFDGEHWFADVVIPSLGETTYRPFVRLAVARYQPESLSDLELSPSVRCEMVQVLPDRTLTVDQSNPDAVVVTLEGTSPVGPNRNRVDVILERSDAPAEIEMTALDAPEDGIGAWLMAAQAEGILGEPIAIERRADGPLRLRIREVERLAPTGQPPPSEAGMDSELNERVVFTDIVPLA